MSKQLKRGVSRKLDANKNKMGKKNMSHGTYRAKRKPNSKYVTNGDVEF
jgi:hypothetical protein